MPSVYAPCSTCRGARYNAKTLEIDYLGKNIAEVLGMTVDDAGRRPALSRRLPIVDVERAILLGSLRKYSAWLNRGGGTPITTLHYFTGLFAEVRQEVSEQYWHYVAFKVRTLEQRFKGSPGHFCPSKTDTK